MFEQSLLDLAARNGRRGWTVIVSSVAQCGFVGLMIVVPMLFTEAGPKLMQRITIGPPPGGVSEPPLPKPPQRRPHAQPQTEFVDGHLQVPVKTPDNIYTPGTPEQPLPDVGGPGPGVPWGTGRSTPGVIKDLVARVIEVAPMTRASQLPATQRIKVSSGVQNALAISRPQPTYPPLAKQARIQGAVRLEAIISKAGTIENLQVLSGHPLLVKAATDAVLQWRYRPTILNGEPVEVITTIEVNFTLSQ